jgi:hypothetical protein
MANAARDLTEQTERMAENELVFRRVNDTISRSRSGEDSAFICECWEPRCRTAIRMSPAEYEHIRQNPRHFLVAPGHEDDPVPGSSRIVRREASYSVTEKIGYAGALAAADSASPSAIN